MKRDFMYQILFKKKKDLTERVIEKHSKSENMYRLGNRKFVWDRWRFVSLTKRFGYLSL